MVLNQDKVAGIITDGDLRRMLYSGNSLEGITAEQIMTPNPLTIDHNSLAMEGVELIKKHKINHVISVKDNSFDGIVHIQDFMREGLL
jgi:arabinose-5-phosphate isomerase